MKRIFDIVTAIVIVSFLVACSSPVTPAAPAAQPTTQPFKVGLLSPGPVHDQGWDQTAYDAFVRIQDELGAQMSYVELADDPAAFQKAFRDYASQGYNMVLGHGFQFQDSAIAVAKDFPNTLFFISSSRYDGVKEGQPNVIGLNTDSSQAYFLLGIIAAKMGKGGGIVGGVESPPISETITGFINGVRSINPQFQVTSTYLGNWTDVAAAKEASLAMVSQGVDFLAPNANIAGNGVYQAIVQANGMGFGTYQSTKNKDNFSACPKNCVANYVLDYGQGLVNIAREAKAGTFKPTSNIEFGLKDKDVLYITYNEQATTPVPADVRKLVDDATQKIISGEFKPLANNPLTKNP